MEVTDTVVLLYAQCRPTDKLKLGGLNGTDHCSMLLWYFGTDHQWYFGTVVVPQSGTDQLCNGVVCTAPLTH